MTVYYADTANLEQLKKLKDLHLVEGCTTNPGIMAKEGRGYSKETIQQIIDVVNAPVSVELTSEDPQKMLEEARMYYSWNRAYVVVKVPFENTKGECQLAIVAKLAAEGIPTNVTCCMNLTQMFAAAQAGATYTSIFWGRVSDQGYNAEEVTNEIVKVFKMSNIKTKIIVGSLRQWRTSRAHCAPGADILTVTPDVLMKSLHHPRSVETQKEFLDTYAKVVGK